MKNKNFSLYDTSVFLVKENRLVFKEGAPESQPSKTEKFAEKPKDLDKKAKEASKDARTPLSEKVADKVKVKDKQSKLDKRLAEILGEKMEDVKLLYELGKYDNAKLSDKVKNLLAKINAKKEELEKAGIKLDFIGGTDGNKHRLPYSLAWNEAKAVAFEKLLAFLEVDDGTMLRSDKLDILKNNKKTIQEYITRVRTKDIRKNVVGFIFSGGRKGLFLNGGGLFDMALALQRAEDIKKRATGKELNAEKDVLVLDINQKKGDDFRKSGLYFSEVRGPFEPPKIEPPKSVTPQPKAPAETKPAETKPAETKPAETKPAETKPFEAPKLEKKPEAKPETRPETLLETKSKSPKLTLDGKTLTVEPLNDKKETYKIEAPDGLKFSKKWDDSEKEDYIEVSDPSGNEGFFLIEDGGINSGDFVGKPNIWNSYNIWIKEDMIVIQEKGEALKDPTKLTLNGKNLLVKYVDGREEKYEIDAPDVFKFSKAYDTSANEDYIKIKVLNFEDSYFAIRKNGEIELNSNDSCWEKYNIEKNGNKIIITKKPEKVKKSAEPEKKEEPRKEETKGETPDFGNFQTSDGEKGIEEIKDVKIAEAFLSWCKEREIDRLDLSDLKSISSEVATALAQFKGERLELNGLNSISPEVAKALAQFKGKRLSLAGLESMSPEVATALAQFKGKRLSLAGLESMSPEVAKALYQFKKEWLNLAGLKSMLPETANALPRFQGEWLNLDGLTSISPEMANALPQFKGKRLSLAGLKSISLEDANALAKFQGEALNLSGLESISPEVVTALAQFKGERLELDGIKSISPDVAIVLSRLGTKVKVFKLELADMLHQEIDAVEQVSKYFKGTNWIKGADGSETGTTYYNKTFGRIKINGKYIYWEFKNEKWEMLGFGREVN